MMFLWIPFLILIPLLFWRSRGDAGMTGCCDAHDARSATPPSAGPDPIEIARQRLARGEINTAQFDEIRRAIG